MIKDVMHVNCPATRAFDLMADPRNEVRWNSGVSAVECKTSEPTGEGSQFTVVDRRGQHEVTITSFDRLHRLKFMSHDAQMDVAIDIVFTEVDGVTTITGTFKPQTRGLMTVLFPLLKPIIRRQIAKEHVNFVRLCEEAN